MTTVPSLKPSQVSVDAQVPSSNRLGALDIVRAPDVLDGGQVGVRRELAHVGALAEAIQTLLLEDLQRAAASRCGW